MNTWKPICHLHDIPPLGARRVARERGMDVALFRTANDEVFALLDRCPHKGGPLSQGLVFGRSVACPLHHWTIALDSGQAQAPDQGCTPVFQVRVQEGQVHLLQRELEGHALDLAPPVAGPCAKRIAIVPNPAPA